MKYETPVMDVISFRKENVISTSGGLSNEIGGESNHTQGF